MQYLGWSFLLWNLIVFFLYGIDKLFAKRGARRVSEAVLLTVSFCMGAFGAIFGMVIWNHKTSKPKFRFLVPLFVLCNAGFIWARFYWLGF